MTTEPDPSAVQATTDRATKPHRKYVGLVDDVRLYLTCTCPISHSHAEDGSDV